MPNYLRAIEVKIENVNKLLVYKSIKDENNYLKMEFSGEFSDEEEPNSLQLTIYNLGQDTISKIKVNNLITVAAGYSDVIGTIISGVIYKVETKRVGGNVQTTIYIQDASEKWLEATVSNTYQTEVRASVILQDVLQNVGLEIGTIQLVTDKLYQTGKVIFGRLSEVIKQIASECDSIVNINNGKIDIVKATYGFETGYVLNAKTGLIRTPEQLFDADSQSEYKIDMLMNHNIRPKKIIKLESKIVNGLFFVIKGVYNTDFTITAEIARLI